MKIITILKIILNLIYVIWMYFILDFTYGMNAQTINCEHIFKDSINIIFDSQNLIFWIIFFVIIILNYISEINFEKRKNFFISNSLLIFNLVVLLFCFLSNFYDITQKC